MADQASPEALLAGPSDDVRQDGWDRLAQLDRQYRSDPTTLTYFGAVERKARFNQRRKIEEALYETAQGWFVPGAVPTGLAWGYVYAGRDFLASEAPEPASVAFWTALSVAPRSVGSAVDRETAALAALDGLGSCLRAQGRMEEADLFAAARDVGLLWRAAPETVVREIGWHDAVRTANRAEDRADAAQRAAKGAFATAMAGAMLGAVQGATAAAAGADYAVETGDTSLYDQGVEQLAVSMVDAMDAASAQAEFADEHGAAMAAVGEVASSLHSTGSTSSDLQGSGAVASASLVWYLAALPEPKLALGVLWPLAERHPSVAESVRGWITAPQEDTAALVALASALATAERYHGERAGAGFEDAVIAAACANGDTVACLEGAAATCRAGAAFGCGVLGRAWAQGIGVPADPGRAATYLRSACEASDAEACVLRAHLTDATDWTSLDQACRLGDPGSCAEAGVHALDTGDDLADARADLRTGCDGQVGTACTRLARSLSAEEPEVASKLYVRGCALGDVAGCAEGGLALASAADPGPASMLLRVACGSGDALACDRLGHLRAERLSDGAGAFDAWIAACEHGSGGGCRSAAAHPLAEARAARDRLNTTLEAACAGGGGAACAELGLLAAAASDWTAASLAHQRGCALGEVVACRAQAEWMLTGRGAAADPAGALALYAATCEAGDSLSCVALADAYTKGGAVDRDPARARQLYAQACASGYDDACASAAGVK